MRSLPTDTVLSRRGVLKRGGAAIVGLASAGEILSLASQPVAADDVPLRALADITVVC
jgi:hypothetical protein